MKMAKMTVYHGGYSEIKKPEIIKGRNTKDIGKVYKRLICEIAEKSKYRLSMLCLKLIILS